MHIIQTAEEFKEKVVGRTDDVLVLVDFFAEWCGPCKAIAPKLEEMSKKHTSVEFYKVDVDQLESVAESEKIQAMPTFKVYRGGKLIGETRGASEANVLKLLAL